MFVYTDDNGPDKDDIIMNAQTKWLLTCKLDQWCEWTTCIEFDVFGRSLTSFFGFTTLTVIYTLLIASVSVEQYFSHRIYRGRELRIFWELNEMFIVLLVLRYKVKFKTIICGTPVFQLFFNLFNNVKKYSYRSFSVLFSGVVFLTLFKITYS